MLKQAVLLIWISLHLRDTDPSCRPSAACLRLMLPAGACGRVGHPPCEPLSPGSPPDLSRDHLWPAGMDLLDPAAPLLASRKGSWLHTGSRCCQAAGSRLPAHCTHRADRSVRWDASGLTACPSVPGSILLAGGTQKEVLLPDWQQSIAKPTTAGHQQQAVAQALSEPGLDVQLCPCPNLQVLLWLAWGLAMPTMTSHG